MLCSVMHYREAFAEGFKEGIEKAQILRVQ